MGIDQTELEPTASADEEQEDCVAAELLPPAKALDSPLPSLTAILPFFLILAGSGMQGYANGTVDAFFVAFLLFLFGIMIVSLLFPGKRPERRAFLLTYAACVFVGGLAQCYSLTTFGVPQNFGDAANFFTLISEKPPYHSLQEFRTLRISFGASLAPVIWQKIYHIRLLLGLDYGPYVGIMCNALTMGLTGSITVRIARELFGDDAWRLRRVGTLVAFCGLFILFGSLLLRDCFTTFFNVLVLWGLIRWIYRPSSKNLLFALTLTGISVTAMVYLRERAIPLFGLLWVLALIFWFRAKRLDLPRFFALMLFVVVLLFSSVYMVSYFQSSKNAQIKQMEHYNTFQTERSQGGSLGMALVINQPLPTRLVLGTGSVMVHPIPFWADFHKGSQAYNLIRGYHGIYQILMLPLVFVGFKICASMFFTDRKRSLPFVFLAIYLLMTTLAVVATSLQLRHIAQFMPAMMIIAAMPDTREKETRRTVWRITLAWFSLVALVHMAWALASVGR